MGRPDWELEQPSDWGRQCLGAAGGQAQNLPSAGLLREACPGGDMSRMPGEWEAGGLERGVALERGSEGCVLDS